MRYLTKALQKKIEEKERLETEFAKLSNQVKNGCLESLSLEADELESRAKRLKKKARAFKSKAKTFSAEARTAREKAKSNREQVITIPQQIKSDGERIAVLSEEIGSRKNDLHVYHEVSTISDNRSDADPIVCGEAVKDPVSRIPVTSSYK